MKFKIVGGIAITALAATLLTPQAHATSVSVYEADNLPVVSARTVIDTSSSSATGGRYYFFYANAETGATISTAAKTDLLTVRARGHQCGGAPQMRITVNGAVVGTFIVAMTKWSNYSVPVALPAGSHSVKVAFTNDYYPTSCDRNLAVDTLTFATAASAPDSVELDTWVPSGYSFGVYGDSRASLYKMTALWSFGKVRGILNAPAGRLIVRARGDMCEGAPQLKATINGVAAPAVTVDSTTYADYDLGPWPGGALPVTVEFINDHRIIGTCDRNALLDTARISEAGKGLDAGTSYQVSAEDQAVMAAQAVLVPYAAKLTNGKDEEDRHTIAGFAGLELDAKTKTVTLHWKGTLPSTTQSIVNAPPSGVTVVVKAAKFSRADLMAARGKLVDPVTGETTSAIASQGGKINKIGSLPSGGGLQVSYTSSTLTNGTLTTTDGTTAPSGTPTVTDAELESIAGVPVSSVFEGAPQPTASRQNDNSAWYGGAAVISPTGKYCTAGFGARRRSDGRHVMITADHCGNYGTGTWRDPAGEVVGNVIARNAERDVALVATPSGKYAGNRVWWGGPLEDSWSRGVRGGISGSGSDYNFTGQRVCTSGAATGVHCNIVITCDDCSNWTADGVFHSPVITARRPVGAAVGTGDSGGPVVEVDGYSVTARGIISSANTPVTCPSVTAIDAKCFTTVNYIAIRAIMRDFGLEMRVAP